MPIKNDLQGGRGITSTTDQWARQCSSSQKRTFLETRFANGNEVEEEDEAEEEDEEEEEEEEDEEEER